MRQKRLSLILRSEKHKAQKLQDIINDTTASAPAKTQISVIEQTNLLKNKDNVLFPGISTELSTILATFPKLGDMAEIRQGLATTDNARFVRYHFDVDPQLIGSLWVPYIKGAGGERFACENPYVVKWGNNGQEIKQAVAEAYPYLKGKTGWVVKNEEFYFRPGLCFSFVNKSGLAVRRLPAGAIFDVASSAIFAKPEDEDFLLAYLNSTPISLLTKSINQTINVQVGDLRKIPVLPFPQKIKDRLSKLGQQCFAAKEKLLQLEYLDLKTYAKDNSQPPPISAEFLQRIFKQHADQQRNLIKKLNNFKSDIDQVVLLGIAQVVDLNHADRIYLAKGSHSPVGAEKNKSQYINEHLLAAKILSSIVSSLMARSNYGEHLVVLSAIDDKNLAKLFNFSSCGQRYMEDTLGQSLQQLFSRQKLFDISKLAGQPSRHFSLWLKENNSCMLFSTLAIRDWQKENDPSSMHGPLSFWRPVCDELSKIKDWTSKDLLSILSAAYP